MKRWFSAIAFLIFATVATNADNPRHRDAFRSANGKFEAKLTSGQWQLSEKSTKRILYTLSDKLADRVWLSSMTLLISDDGTSVIALDDFSRQSAEANPEVLLFFGNGERIRAYRLNDVIENRFVSFSVSHFSWCFLPSQVVVLDNMVSIVTNDLRKLTFDVRTGDMTGNENDSRIPAGSIFVAGKVRRLGKEDYELTASCVVRGDIKMGAKIPFTADKSVFISEGIFEAVVIKDGKAVGNYMIGFNNCP